MTTKKKTPLHKHSHPAYAWIALVISALLILGVSGWYYLTYTGGLNDEVVLNVKNLSTTKSTSSSVTTDTIDIDTETSLIDEEMSSLANSDLNDNQLDDTILGIQ